MSSKHDAAVWAVITQAAAFNVTLPITVGFWTRPAGNGVIYSLGGSGSDIGFRLEVVSGVDIRCQYFNGTTDSGRVTCTSGVVASAWNYVLLRMISSTNRRLSTFPMGTPVHAQDTASVTPGTLTLNAIGAAKSNTEYAYYSGEVAEFFIAKADVQPGGGQMNEAILHQLAFLGPWSLPHLVPSIYEYRSFRKGTGSNQDDGGEVFSRGGPWVAVAGNVGAHPALYSNYVRPRQNRRLLVV